MKAVKLASLACLCVFLAATLTPVLAEALGSGSFKKDKEIEVSLGLPLDKAAAENVENYTVFEKPDPDIRIPVKKATLDATGTTVTLSFQDPLNLSAEYIVQAKGLVAEKQPVPLKEFLVKKGRAQILFGILLGAMLIQNFVFTKYLGLCIFFGVSQKKETAIGMGVTFTLVMTLGAFMCWALYSYVLQPLHLDFLKVIVFIGTVAIFVQAVDTILRKVNPYLFKKLGVYLVLIVTNCIVLAVPIINSDANYGPFESITEGLGAGVGFAIALFLMACVREKLELARIPAVFKGLPIAFVVTGLFALAFLGFSGLAVF